jgi:hypothetical protein
LLTSNLALDAKTTLQEDKGQDQNEHGFRWTKSPIHLGTVWLEKPERVAGLGYVLWLALTIVRAELKDQPPLELPYRKVKRPSETVILEAFRDLDLRRQSNETSTWYQLPYYPISAAFLKRSVCRLSEDWCGSHPANDSNEFIKFSFPDLRNLRS